MLEKEVILWARRNFCFHTVPKRMTVLMGRKFLKLLFVSFSSTWCLVLPFSWRTKIKQTLRTLFPREEPRRKH